MRFILNYASICFLISLLTGCSCTKKTATENDNQNLAKASQEILEIKIVDPFIGNNIDFSKQTTYQAPTKKKNNLADKSKNKLSQNKALIKKAKAKSKKLNKSNLELINYESGLKCQILRNGPSSGKLPKKGQTVRTHYIGWLSDNGEPGEQIDSTYERNLPFEFKVGEQKVIKAWDEAVMDMRVGDQRRLFIPSELAWGQAGAKKLVPGNSDLIYEIEILEIK